jgi:hypothetical protein
MRTLSAETSTKWMRDLIEIEAALLAVDDLRPMVPHDVWAKVSRAKIKAGCMRDLLLAHVTTDITVEVRTAA